MEYERREDSEGAGGAPFPEALHISEVPQLRDPLLVAAFAGWNDAAGAATWAVRFLVDRWGAQRFADIEPEEFFSFTDTRPQTKLTGGVVREITWPSNEFYYARVPEPPEGEARPRRRRPEPSRDTVLLLGTEPNLRWKTFVKMITDLCQRLGVAQVVLLGGLLADVPHTRPVPITAASTPELAEQVALTGLGRSKYQGPTGILGVLHDACHQANIPVLSLWGAAPHYLTVSPNLQVSAALLSRLNELLNLHVNLRELQTGAARFQERVSSVVEQDPEASNYVHQLEERMAGGEDEEMGLPPEFDLPPVAGESHPRGSGELPSADVLIQDIEELLRQNRRGDALDDEGDGG